jgi:hypothetical protein
MNRCSSKLQRDRPIEFCLSEGWGRPVRPSVHFNSFRQNCIKSCIILSWKCTTKFNDGCLSSTEKRVTTVSEQAAIWKRLLLFPDPAALRSTRIRANGVGCQSADRSRLQHEMLPISSNNHDISRTAPFHSRNNSKSIATELSSSSPA